jgi:hypothetical protein
LDLKDEVNEFLLSRLLNPEDMKRPEELVRPLDSNIAKLAEVLWILRPVIYGPCVGNGARFGVRLLTGVFFLF